LPTLDKLLEIIVSEIRQKGPITFERFMDIALYHPELGYYMKKNHPFGPRGDYYTSAHLPLFGETLALQAIELLEATGMDKLTIVELGPGMGYLAEGILKKIENHDLCKKIKYILAEKNPHLREVQREYLKGFSTEVEWVDPDNLEPFEGLIIANELLDALPVHLIEFKGDEFLEVYLTVERNQLTETLGPLSKRELSDYIKKYRIPEINRYRTEINLKAKELLYELKKILKKGMVLFIDYGYPAYQYYAPERTRGTLLCYSKHKTDEAIYENPGKKDITAHVNFSAIKDWAESFGFNAIGFTSQGSFLVGLGIDKLIEEHLAKDRHFYKRLPAVKGLLFDMGQTHQVLAISKGLKNLKFKGFSISNRLYLL